MSDDETKECSEFSRNSKVTELLELCIQPQTRKEMQHALLDYWDKFEECVSRNNDFNEFDVAVMYALLYHYDHSSVQLSAVVTSLYAYLKQVQFVSAEGNRSMLINCGSDCFMSALRCVTDFNCPERERIFTDAALRGIMTGNYGLTAFLVKFGLVDFPLEIDEKSRKLVKKCVSLFNELNTDVVGSIPVDLQAPVQVDDLLNKMQQNKEITFRRSMFILCKFCLFFEFIKFDDPEYEFLKCFPLGRLLSLEMVVETTAEQDITLKDIEYFLETYLRGHLSMEVWRYFQKSYSELYPNRFKNRRTRSLKDLNRCKIRECLLSSTTTLPEQVSKLPLPTSLKEYLFLEYGRIWEALISGQEHVYAHEMLHRLI